MFVAHENVITYRSHDPSSPFSTCSKLDSKPPGPWHDCMMEDMKESHLAIFLTQNKKDLK